MVVRVGRSDKRPVRTLSPRVFPVRQCPPVLPSIGVFVCSDVRDPKNTGPATIVASAPRKCAELKHAAKTGNDCRVIDLRKLTRLRSDGTTRRAKRRARALQRRRPPMFWSAFLVRELTSGPAGNAPLFHQPQDRPAALIQTKKRRLLAAEFAA